MAFQLDFNKKMDLIRAVSKEPRYRENFYEYTASLAKKHNISRMSEERLDNFLHDREWLVDFGPTSSDWYKRLYFCHFLGRDGHIFIFTSLDIEKEIADKLAVKFHLAEDEISRIMLDFGTFTIPVEPTKKISFIKGDPDDDKFLECGIACQANYIVSGVSHLQRAKEFEGIKILSPSDFLATIQSEE